MQLSVTSFFISNVYVFVVYTRSVTNESGKLNGKDQRAITTQLLINLTKGDRGAVDALLPPVYGELRSLAGNYLRRERPYHTLQPTALVHEAYLSPVDQIKLTPIRHFYLFRVPRFVTRNNRRRRTK